LTILNGITNIKILRYLIFLFFLKISLCSFSQVSKNFEFGNHLINQGNFREAIEYPNLINNAGFSVSQFDSLDFIIGKASFYSKDFELAIQKFNTITDIKLFETSIYYLSLSNLYIGKTGLSESLVRSLSNNNLNSLVIKGDYILANKVDSARLMKLDNSGFLIKKHFNDLDQIIERVETRKIKSPILAATMSAIIPGSGKFYTGKIGEGVASLLMVGILTASSIEQYNNGGFVNPQFYLMSLPAAFFYVGNIYGSYFSVKVANIEFNEEIRNEVLFHLHIPFKSIYRQ